MKLGKTIRRYLLNNRSYGETGVRDDHLQLNNVNINVSYSYPLHCLILNVQGQDGTIHFIRFPTEKMLEFIRLVKSKGFTQLSSTVCATGGGAHKYALQIENVRLSKLKCITNIALGTQFTSPQIRRAGISD